MHNKRQLTKDLRSGPKLGQIYDRLGRRHSIKSYVPGAQNGGTPSPSYTPPPQYLMTNEDSSAYKAYFNRYLAGKADSRAQDLFTTPLRPDLIPAALMNKLLVEKNAYEDAMRQMANKRDGGWLDEYQAGGNPTWDFSTMKTAPQTALPTASTYTRPTQNTAAFMNPNLKKSVVQQTIDKEREDAIPLQTRGEKPLEYVPIEAAFLPAARGLGWAGNLAADMITGTMRNPGKSLLKELPGSPNIIPKVTEDVSHLSWNELERAALSDQKGVLPDINSVINWNNKTKGVKDVLSYGPQPQLLESDFYSNPSQFTAKSGSSPDDILLDMVKQFADSKQISSQLRSGARDYGKKLFFPNPSIYPSMNRDIIRNTGIYDLFGKNLPLNTTDAAIGSPAWHERMNIWKDFLGKIKPEQQEKFYRPFQKDIQREYKSVVGKPYTGQEAFNYITPNRYGGSNNWLDDYNT